MTLLLGYFLHITEQGCGSASLYSDPYPFFSFNPDPDPTSAPNPRDANLRPLISIPSTRFHFKPLSLIVSDHVPPWLHFEPLNLLNFYLNVNLDPDPAFHSNVDLDPDPASLNKGDPDPHPQS
jgi:hypothetical protein